MLYPVIEKLIGEDEEGREGEKKGESFAILIIRRIRAVKLQILYARELLCAC